jgi:hypothetical protein
LQVVKQGGIVNGDGCLAGQVIQEVPPVGILIKRCGGRLGTPTCERAMGRSRPKLFSSDSGCVRKVPILPHIQNSLEALLKDNLASQLLVQINVAALNFTSSKAPTSGVI